MARKDFTLFDSFQEKGYWWFPETPDKQVPGILFHTERETKLELFGELYEESLAEKGIVKQHVPFRSSWIKAVVVRHPPLAVARMGMGVE